MTSSRLLKYFYFKSSILLFTFTRVPTILSWYFYCYLSKGFGGGRGMEVLGVVTRGRYRPTSGWE